MEQEKVLLTWEAESRPYNPIDEQTRPVVLVLAVLVGIVLLFTGETMIMIVLGSLAFLYVVWNKNPPEKMEFTITNKGIRAFDRVYMWWEFGRWWIEEKQSGKVLILEMISGLVGRLYLPLEERKSEDVKKVMSKYLVFDQPQDTAADKLARWVGEKFPLRNS